MQWGTGGHGDAYFNSLLNYIDSGIINPLCNIVFVHDRSVENLLQVCNLIKCNDLWILFAGLWSLDVENAIFFLVGQCYRINAGPFQGVSERWDRKPNGTEKEVATSNNVSMIKKCQRTPSSEVVEFSCHLSNEDSYLSFSENNASTCRLVLVLLLQELDAKVSAQLCNWRAQTTSAQRPG